jgi:DNA-binding SARP family transcriptional activator
MRGVVARPELVARFAQSVAPATWLAAPSGTGKSTLVAGYAEGCGRTPVWYRLDSRDDDPAFFYGNLAAALAAVVPALPPLPRFTAEDSTEESTFVDRFIAPLRGGGVPALLLVFDDVHRVQDEARIGVLARFARAADDAIAMVFIAEVNAPPAFFDAIAARKLSLCNDLPLQFSPDECVALAANARVPAPDGEALAALTGGHAAALVLACELLRGSGLAPSLHHPVVEQIHLHLLDRLLQAATPARRLLLEKTAFAPQITAELAQALAGETAAAELESLAACGLLRRIGAAPAPIFEAHGLLRRGMQTLLRQRQTPAAVQASAVETAQTLARLGANEQAFALLVECEAPEAAIAVLDDLARTWARSGQAARLTRALGRLPSELVERRPWLCFWAGQSLLGSDEEAARAWFERAHAGFEAAQDTSGMRVAAACVVTAFGLDYGDIRSLDLWLARHRRVGGDQAVPRNGPHEALLCLGVVCAAVIEGSYPAGFDDAALVVRLRELVDTEAAWLTPDQPVEAARLLIDHARIFMTAEAALAMIVATRTHAESAAASALQRGRWWLSAALAADENAQPATAGEYRARAQALVDTMGSRRLAFELGMSEVDAAIRANDHATAAARLAELETMAINAPPAQKAEHARLTARVLLLQGRAREGLHWAQAALDHAEIAGFTAGKARTYLLEAINAFAANDRLDEAIAHNALLLQGLTGRQRGVALAMGEALAYLAADGEDDDALRRAFAHAGEAGSIYLFSRAPKVVARLCERALARGIEADFAHRVIAVQQLPPPEDAGPTWPWPVRVRTLGGFELEIGGERYAPSHKAQDKPLELLKLLIAAQVLGRDSVDKLWVAERLWPDADTGNARKSLDMTISRVRRLLADDAALQTPEGRLMLSPRHVWTDVAPLLRVLRRVGTQRDLAAAGQAPPAAVVAAEIAAVLDLYRGPFLPDEEPPPWLIAGREAVTAAVRSALLTAETVLKGRDDERLLPAMARAFALDPTSEDLARALMRLHLRHGRHGEALTVYRRTREMLSIVLSVAPSVETEGLKEQCYAAAAAGHAAPNAGGSASGVIGPR